MASCHVAITIDRPAEEVFRALAEVERWPERIAAISRIEPLTPGPIAVGARFRETRVMFGREATEEMEITALEPPRRLALRADSCGAIFASEHRLTSVEGGTRLELSLVVTPVGWLAKLFAPFSRLMMGSMQKCLAADLADLKVSLESSGVESHATFATPP